jgi:hypothetical protein
MPEMTEGQAKAAEAMNEMRTKLVTTSPSELGFQSDEEFPHLYGAMLEFRLDELTATVYGLKDGSASVYTTGGFGVLGGIGHDSVRQAARQFVTVASKYRDRGEATATFPYPADGKAQFYFLTYDGPTLCVVDEDAVMSGQDQMREVYAAGQDLLTQLRLVQQQAENEGRTNN